MKLIPLALAATALTLGSVSCAAAQSGELLPLFVMETIGTYSGTYRCSAGEQGVTLVLKDGGTTSQASDGRLSRNLKGALTFYPTHGNPDSPQGAFEVSGSVMMSRVEGLSQLTLVPGEWIDQPENWGAAGIEGVITEGRIEGRPTAAGCSDMVLYPVRTGRLE